MFLLLALAGIFSASAYPPAPYHTIYGMVRDQYGTPLMGQAQVIFESPSGVQITTSVLPNLGLDQNYQIQVPMDAGLTPDLYQSTALTVSAPFKMYVVVGSVTNLPLQMVGDYSHLGEPSQATRIDLTLGVDANGDGIPDAWEEAFLAALGSNLSLSDLNSGLDLANDGRTLRQEYVLGAYPFEPGTKAVVKLVGVENGSPVLEFPTITGRSYTILGSSDLKQWSPVSFRLNADGPDGPLRSYYNAPGIQTVRVQVAEQAAGTTAVFFKLLIQ